MAEALERAVVQIPMRRLHFARQRLRVHGESVVLRRDRDGARRQVGDRVIRAAVSELQLESPGAEREPEELVSETDPEDRAPAEELLDRRDRAGQRGGIPGAVREEDPVRVARQDAVGRRVRGKDGHAAPRRVE
jgi:hypothetical protein